MRRWLPFVVVAVVFGALTLLSAPSGGARSVTDRTGRGYRAAFAYLAGGATADGAPAADVAAWDGPLHTVSDLPPDATLVIAWPLERPLDGAADTNALLSFAARGGRLVLLLDGASDATPPADLVEDALGVTLVREAATPPYGFSEWKSWAAARRRATGPSGVLALAEPKWRLECPVGADTLATTDDGYERACRVPRGRGEAIVISDATVWQNDSLARADNLAFLEAVLGARATRGPQGESAPVRFAEWPHGDAPLPRSIPGHVPLLLFAHLGLLWLVGALTLARRFGDPLPAPALAAPSMAKALHALATLHRGSGHAHDAARRLAALIRARGARRGVDAEVIPRPDVVTDAALVDYAAEVAAVQRDHRL